MTPVEQRTASLRLANTQRRAQRDLKIALREGTIQFADLLAAPPPFLASVPIIDLIRWTRAKKGPSLVTIGRAAVRDGVNLMLPLGDASAHSRGWVAENATHCARRSVVHH